MPDHTVPVLDFFHPDFTDNPYPMIDRMLREEPIAFDPRLGGWLIGRHGDAEALQGDPRLTSRRIDYVTAALSPELRAKIAPLADWYEQWIVMKDPPEHTRLRRLAARAFQPRNLRRLEGWIETLVDELLDKATGDKATGEGGTTGREMDVVKEFAFPLPQTVISEMVGVPAADRDKFLAWTDDFVALLSASLTTAEAIEHALGSYQQLKDYFAALIADRDRPRLEGELLGELIAASEDEDRLTAEEVLNLVAFIMTGGYETTAHLISNGVLLFLQNPDQLALVREDPALMPGAIEEILRCEPPIIINTRAVATAMEFQGYAFEPGQLIYFVASAINRDPERFVDPHRFDVRRPDNKHLSFGFGAHFCLGAALARMEGKIALRRLLARLPGLQLVDQPIARLPRMATRPLESLLVRW